MSLIYILSFLLSAQHLKFFWDICQYFDFCTWLSSFVYTQNPQNFNWKLSFVSRVHSEWNTERLQQQLRQLYIEQKLTLSQDMSHMNVPRGIPNRFSPLSN